MFLSLDLEVEGSARAHVKVYASQHLQSSSLRDGGRYVIGSYDLVDDEVLVTNPTRKAFRTTSQAVNYIATSAGIDEFTWG